jgi:hypothetical protein
MFPNGEEKCTHVQKTWFNLLFENGSQTYTNIIHKYTLSISLIAPTNN